ncbi:cytochrome c [Proteobacteria bacterium 005FR1]|nr:cytochrome c [Proteobacteria bacterium 005FR1]
MITRAIYFAVLTSLFAASASATSDNQAVIARGKYLVQIAGCNDCHTHGYPEAAGNIPITAWLTGSAVGFQGPWGTSYPANLRLLLDGMTEAQWVARARQPMLPPMPWFALRDMSDSDLGAIYHFVRSLGPAGKQAPAAAQPDEVVATPYIEFVPKNLPQQASAQ